MSPSGIKLFEVPDNWIYEIGNYISITYGIGTSCQRWFTTHYGYTWIDRPADLEIQYWDGSRVKND